MKHFRSEYAFQKYKPHVNWRKRFVQFFRKKKYRISSTNDSFHYKTNPYKAHKKPRKIKIRLILFILFLLAWTVCLAYIPYFRVNRISYTGLTNTTKTEMDEFINQNFLNKKSILPLNGYFFINTGKISAELYGKFAFETVEVIKIFPNRLDVNIKEKISSVIYDNGKKYFLLDSGGTAIKYLTDVSADEIIQKIATNTTDMLNVDTTSTQINASTTEHLPDYKKINKLFGNYPIVYDRRNFDADVKQEGVLPPEHIVAIIAWYKILTEQGIAQPKFFTLDNLNSGIAIDTTEPWNILFQPKNDNNTQINTLREILTTIKPQQYIDLRFKEKVYWK